MVSHHTSWLGIRVLPPKTWPWRPDGRPVPEYWLLRLIAMSPLIESLSLIAMSSLNPSIGYWGWLPWLPSLSLIAMSPLNVGRPNGHCPLLLYLIDYSCYYTCKFFKTREKQRLMFTQNNAKQLCCWCLIATCKVQHACCACCKGYLLWADFLLGSLEHINHKAFIQKSTKNQSSGHTDDTLTHTEWDYKYVASVLYYASICMFICLCLPIFLLFLLPMPSTYRVNFSYIISQFLVFLGLYLLRKLSKSIAGKNALGTCTLRHNHVCVGPGKWFNTSRVVLWQCSCCDCYHSTSTEGGKWVSGG